MSRPTISVIIPTLNEEGNLRHVLPRIPAEVDEVILVDGHSTDRTVEVARELYPDIRVVSQEGRGKGAALRSGFRAARGDIVVMLDADGSTDPQEIPFFVHALLAGADFAKGSRFLHGGGTSDMPFHRRLGNAAFVRMVRALYGGQYTDLCYGYNAFWRRVVPLLDLDGDGFEIETMMNIRALRAGLRIIEVPSFEDRRVHGVGRLRTIPDGWRVLRTIWGERRRPSGADEDRPADASRRPAVAIPVVVGNQPMNFHAASDSRFAHIDAGSRNGHAAGTAGNGHAAGTGGNGHAARVLDEYAEKIIDRRGFAEASNVPVYGEVSNRREAAPVDPGTWQQIASDYADRLQQLIRTFDHDAIGRVVDELRQARSRGATIFFAGNGGSSATAAHWVNDLGKATKLSGQRPMRVMNLSDNVPWLTALGNDEGIERVFAGQLENFAQPGDVVVIISASGNSPNILRLLEMAREFGMRTIGLVGFDGGRALSLLDEALWIETEIGAYGLVETAHTVLADIVTTCLIGDRAGVLDAAR